MSESSSGPQAIFYLLPCTAHSLTRLCANYEKDLRQKNWQRQILLFSGLNTG